MTRLLTCAIGTAGLCLGLLWQPGLRTVCAQPSPTAEERYASPLELLLSPDGTRLYVLCQGADEVRVLSAATGVVVRTIPVGHVPRGFSVSADGRQLFVANSWDDTVTVIDTESGRVQATWAAGFEPSSVVEDRAGKTLYVADRIGNDITVLDAATGVEKATLRGGARGELSDVVGRWEPVVLRRMCIPTPHRTGRRRSEITVIDPARGRVVDRMPLPDIAGMFHVAFSAMGGWVWRRNCTRRTWCLWRMWSMAGPLWIR